MLDDALAGQQEAWQRMRTHPFLGAIREGTLPAATFERWLAQDHLFVAGSLPFLGALLASAPCEARPVLASAIAGYQAELQRFGETAGRLGVDLTGARPAFVTHAYLQFLLATAHRSFPQGLLVLTVLERAYLDCWRGVRDGLAAKAPWRPLVEQWTTDEFAAYVRSLEELAERATDGAGSAERRVLTDHIELTIGYELAFWEMAWHGWTWPGAGPVSGG
ncbi:MAG: TenA family transcriptional regulator [Candidatus Dormiibacterota bacterium]